MTLCTSFDEARLEAIRLLSDSDCRVQCIYFQKICKSSKNPLYTIGVDYEEWSEKEYDNIIH